MSKPVEVTYHARDRFAQRCLGYRDGVGEVVNQTSASAHDVDEKFRERFDEAIPVSFHPQNEGEQGYKAKIHPETYQVFLYNTQFSDETYCEADILITIFPYSARRSEKIRLLQIRACACCDRLYWPDEWPKCDYCGASQENTISAAKHLRQRDDPALERELIALEDEIEQAEETIADDKTAD